MPEPSRENRDAAQKLDAFVSGTVAAARDAIRNTDAAIAELNGSIADVDVRRKAR